MSESKTPIELVREFCGAWSRRDANEIAAYFAEDAVYHNIPTPPLKGRQTIADFIGRFAGGATSVEFEIVHMAAAGDVVMNERIDRFTMRGKSVALPVAGVFEVRDGKIAAWRDYFDLAMYANQLKD